jgi:hypothetical protein
MPFVIALSCQSYLVQTLETIDITATSPKERFSVARRSQGGNEKGVQFFDEWKLWHRTC